MAQASKPSTTTVKHKVVKKKKVARNVPKGLAFINATYNNTIVSVTDLEGNVLGWASAGMVGFKGPKKATPYAASMIVKKIMEGIAAVGIQEVTVYIKGIGQGREGAIRAFHANNVAVNGINDVTPIPHNGCRPRKRRRV